MTDEHEWDARKAASKVRRAGNRQRGRDAIESAGVPYETNNNGVHMILRTSKGIIDFWPGTGKWTPRKRTQDTGRGTHSLMTYILQAPNDARVPACFLNATRRVPEKEDHPYMCVVQTDNGQEYRRAHFSTMDTGRTCWVSTQSGEEEDVRYWDPQGDAYVVVASLRHVDAL